VFVRVESWKLVLYADLEHVIFLVWLVFILGYEIKKWLFLYIIRGSLFSEGNIWHLEYPKLINILIDIYVFTSFMYVQCVALNNVLYVALLLVWLSPLYCVFFCEEFVSVHLTWPIAQWHSLLILFCVCHVVHDQLKGKRFRNKLVLCKSASFIFLYLFWNSLCACVGCFLILIGAQFFLPVLQILYFLVAWKFMGLVDTKREGC
jgi:hypothetical protein